jgi:hypothetical protein
MDILQGVLPSESNKCINTNNLSLILNIDNTLLESIIFLKLNYSDSIKPIIKKGCNVLYFIAERYQYQDISDYLLYLDINKYYYIINLTKYLIYLSSKSLIEHKYIPSLVYLILYTDCAYWHNAYKNLQYFIYIDGKEHYTTNLNIKKSYLVLAIFKTCAWTFNCNSRHLLCIKDAFRAKITCVSKNINYIDSRK